MSVKYAVIQLDDCVDHVRSISNRSLKDARKFVTFLQKEEPDGTFLIAKIVATVTKPRRWRLS